MLRHVPPNGARMSRSRDIFGKKGKLRAAVSLGASEKNLADRHARALRCAAQTAICLKKDSGRSAVRVVGKIGKRYVYVVCAGHHIFKNVVLLRRKRGKGIDKNGAAGKKAASSQKRRGLGKNPVGILPFRGDLSVESREDHGEIGGLCPDRQVFVKKTGSAVELRRRDLVLIERGTRRRQLLDHAEAGRLAIFFECRRERAQDVPHDELFRTGADIIRTQAAVSAENIVAEAPEGDNVNVSRAGKLRRPAFRRNRFPVGDKQIHMSALRRLFHSGKNPIAFTRTAFAIDKSDHRRHLLSSNFDHARRFRKAEPLRQ